MYKTLPSTGYTGSKMKKGSDILTFYNISKDKGYTGDEHRSSKRKTFFLADFAERVEKIQEENRNESNDFWSEGMKLIMPSNIIDIWTR